MCRLEHALFAHQPRDVLLPVFAAFAADDALHGSIGFEQRAVHAHRLACDQILDHRDLQHELEDFCKDFLWQTLARVGKRRMVWRLIAKRDAHKVP